MNLKLTPILLLLLFPLGSLAQTKSTDDYLNSPTWTADNGNGTFSNPLFYDEFSDPDLIRVGDDYYMTGTTMHTMPGLPILHSRDLVNWEFLSYAVERLDLGPQFHLEEGKNIYGRGIWAPSFRYHQGTFYIFSNVNGQTTQLFTAKNPKGPWAQTRMKRGFHDLSVLFDDDGKIYVVWGYDEVRLAELDQTLTDIVPGSEKVIVPRGSGAGEGSHFYKIDGKYFITSTNWDPVCYQVVLRADKPEGPYEMRVMSAEENLGVGTGWRLANERSNPPFELIPPIENYVGRIPMHQGGIVQTQTGEWWGWSMMDHNSVGRLTCLSLVTWMDGFPYFGLPGNLTRSPKIWVKPNTGFSSAPRAPYRRSDDFSAKTLQPIWQWNHVPLESRWSLAERPGYLRLKSLNALDFWAAKNTLTQRAIGPESIVTTEIDVTGLQRSDVAGLGLLNMPYAWIGIVRTDDGNELRQFDQQKGKTASVKIDVNRLWLRAECNFDTEKARFSYSLDGDNFTPLGEEFLMIYQGRTFQGIRYCLFNFNTEKSEGGYADFNNFIVKEPRPRGLTKPIPFGKVVTLTSLADSTILTNWKNFVRPVAQNSKLAEGNLAKFRVVDKGLGRIALQSVASGGWVTVKGAGEMSEVRIEKEQTADSVFQWEDMERGDIMLMSLKTNRYLFVDPRAESLAAADARGASPDRRNGASFSWIIVSAN